MKLFFEMTPIEKIDHIQKCMDEISEEIRGSTPFADILDVWDYWMPYALGRLRKLEAVAESAKRLHDMHNIGDTAMTDNEYYPLHLSLVALEKP